MTLLELVIVVVIVGVLASIAFPKVINMARCVEAVEAIDNLKHIHRAIQRCLLMSGVDDNTVTWDILTACAPLPGDFSSLDIDNPFLNPQSRFALTGRTMGGVTPYCYGFTASHKTYPGRVKLQYCSGDSGGSSCMDGVCINSRAGVTIVGSRTFASIRQGPGIQ